MAYILSMIANPAAPVIDDKLTARMVAALGGAEAKTLAPGVAVDLLSARGGQDILAAARQVSSGRPVDVNLLLAENRRKKLFIADMDSTIIAQECIDELAEAVGKRAEIAAITERAMRGALDFEGALEARVAMLKGLPVAALEKTYNERISLTPGARALVQTMNALGAATALVSGGFSFFVERVAAAAGFQHAQANELIIEDGVLTGAVAKPILGRAAKQAALIRLANAQGLSLHASLAAGDGANDLQMLQRAGLGVAFRAKPAVAEAAHARIEHGDLTALLYLQGIAQPEFVGA